MPKFSTGLRNSMLNDTGFKTLMDGGELRIFAVTAPDVVPLTADDAEAGELLMTLTAGGTGGGLNFSAPEGAAISKAEAEVWMTSSWVLTASAPTFVLCSPPTTAWPAMRCHVFRVLAALLPPTWC